MASVSKAMATTSMAMLLWERGQLDLDEPLGWRLPEFLQAGSEAESLAASLRSTITPRMLLAHCSGLPAYAPLYKTCATASELLEACLHMPLEALPGTRAVYSDIGFILLGHLLETNRRRATGQLLSARSVRASGNELDAVLPSRGNSKPPFRRQQTRTIFVVEFLQGEVHDGNCWRLGGVSGHAGLFSNVPDTLRLADCLLTSGARHFSCGNNFTFHNATAHASIFRLGVGLGYADCAFFVRDNVQRSFRRSSRLYRNFALD